MVSTVDRQLRVFFLQLRDIRAGVSCEKRCKNIAKASSWSWKILKESIPTKYHSVVFGAQKWKTSQKTHHEPHETYSEYNPPLYLGIMIALFCHCHQYFFLMFIDWPSPFGCCVHQWCTQVWTPTLWTPMSLWAGAASNIIWLQAGPRMPKLLWPEVWHHLWGKMCYYLWGQVPNSLRATVPNVIWESMHH